MRPLVFADSGQDFVIHRVGGLPEVKKHLEDLGFVAGGIVSVINISDGNLIVRIKNTRVAISKELAQKIMI